MVTQQGAAAGAKVVADLLFHFTGDWTWRAGGGGRDAVDGRALNMGEGRA